MKIKTRLLIAMIGIGVLPLISATAILSYSISEQTNKALFDQVSEKLVAVREMKRDQLVSYFDNLQNVARSIATNPNTISAMRDLANGFDLYSEPDEQEISAIKQYYQNDFLQKYKSVDTSVTPDSVESFISSADKATLFYQSRYIAQNEYPLGEKQKLDQATRKGKFAARYDLYHATYHPELRRIQEQFGFYDLFLIDNTGRVVYSVFKEADYGTDLANGNLKDSGLAKAWRSMENAEPGSIYLSDFSAYTPSYGAPAAFMALPVFDGKNRTGSLIFQVSQAQVTSVLTSNQQWKTVGLGISGEAFLIGADQRLRSESRVLLENPDEYFQAIEGTGWQDRIAEIKQRHSAVALQQVKSEAAEHAMQGETGVVETTGYLNRSVISAFSPLKIMGQNWAIISQIDTDEAFQEKQNILNTIARNSLLICLVVLAFAVLFSLTMAKRLINPLRELVQSFQDLAKGQGNLSVQLSSANRQDEIGELSVGFNAFISNIRSVVIEVAKAASQLSHVADRLNDQTHQTLNGMSVQRDKTQTVASAMTEFAASIDEVARSSHETFDAMSVADQVTLSGSDNAARSAQEIEKLAAGTQASVVSISHLSDQIKEISSVLEVINGIASQTSLLALNAAIEAARAGEMGRGFAVVADEVRSLSSRTQAATVNIQQKIELLRSAADASVGQVNQAMLNADTGMTLVQETAHEIQQIRRLVGDVQSMHAQITAALTQQQSTVKEMETNLMQMHELAQDAENNTEKSVSQAEELHSLSGRLKDLVGRFNT